METLNHIFGIHSITEALRANKTLSKLYLQSGLSGTSIKKLEELARKSGVSISFVPLAKLNKLSSENHQGAVALVAPIEFMELEEILLQADSKQTPPLFLLLDGVTDVRNFGAIIRTADACGVTAIIIPKTGSAPVNGITLKTSAGAAYHIPIARVDHIKDAVFLLQANEIQVVAATEKTSEMLYKQDFTKPTAIIMGSEERGVNPSVLKIVDAKAKLPLLGKVASLNVSVACGAFLYEVVRQRADSLT